jgi:hypothetical protein
MPRSELVDIAAQLKHETERAYLLYDGAREAWVPKAAVEKNEDGTWTMPLRLAKEKEFV